MQVDTGARIEDRPTSLIPTGQVSAPTNVVAEGYSIVNQGLRSANVNCSWAGVDQAISYDIQVRRTSQSNGQWSQGWTNLASQSSTSVDLTNVLTGTYQFRVRAVSRDGGSSPWAESNQVFVDGKRGSIPAVAGLNGVGIVNGITWRWMTGTDDLVDMKSTELQFRRVDDNGSPVGDWIDLSVVTYPTGTFTQNGLGFAERVQVRARFVSSYSDAGPWNTPVMAMTSDNMDDYYQNIDDAIKGSDTYGELTDGIKEVSDSAQAAKDAAQAAQVTADGAVATNQQQQQQINNQAAEIAQNAKDITAAANAGSDNAKAIAQEILDRQAGDLATANKAASDVADAIAKAETDDAEVAAQAAANLLATKTKSKRRSARLIPRCKMVSTAWRSRWRPSRQALASSSTASRSGISIRTPKAGHRTTATSTSCRLTATAGSTLLARRQPCGRRTRWQLTGRAINTSAFA